AGCNTGGCHGASRGKDGFSLSLFGYNPKGDYYSLTQEMIGRRINTSIPEKSLLLTKATGEVPHTGGDLFTKDSEHYKTIYNWILKGAPDDKADVPETIKVVLSTERITFNKKGESQAIKVTEHNNDGSTRDVTSLAQFSTNNSSVATVDEHGNITAVGAGDTYVFARFSRFSVGVDIIVLPEGDDFVWKQPKENNYIDKLVYARLQKLHINPSEICDDETFLRRVTVDLAGRTPTVDEYHAFMADNRANKRSIKIDILLESDGFTDLWTAIWAEQLRLVGGQYAPVATHTKAADTFFKWIKKQIHTGRPLNEFVAEMVGASGSNLTNGPANLYTMMVHKPRFDPKVFAADFSQLFMGIQIQCAECHNHPFDRWTMEDYYSLVSFFNGVKRKSGVEARERRIFYDVSAPPAKHLVDGRPMPAKVFDSIEPVPAGGDSRKELAKWLTAPTNKLFSRNLANRIWAQMMGKGVVNPVDDVRVSNPPVNGPLLDALDESLVKSGFKLRSLVRDICNSQVYQLSTKPTKSNKLDTRQFSHSYLKKLRADVLLDSVVTVTGIERRFRGFPEGTKALEYYPRMNGDTAGANFGDDFFKTFGRSSRATIAASETKVEPTLTQALHLAVGDTFQARIGAGGKIDKLVKSKSNPNEILDALFIMTLSRKPTELERSELLNLIGETTKDSAVYKDIFWGLLNSTEFSFNH
ncbi:MAG: DUF1549 domain-containing protein, partial [Lentisphaeraceae bacterium]|nr:DUF1549 domain-containing protein [Lentisphaeraceae bacterium]